MAAKVPIPTPTILPEATMPIQQVMATLVMSMRFLPKPRLRRHRSPTTLARPSAGLGISFILTLMETPMPVIMTAMISMIKRAVRDGSVSPRLCRRRSKPVSKNCRSRLKATENGSCSQSVHFLDFPSRRISINVNAAYIRNARKAKLRCQICDMAKGMEISGETPRSVLVLRLIPHAKIIIPAV